MKRENNLNAQVAAPPPSEFPRYPKSWYYVCTAKSLRRGQVKKARICGEDLAVFRADNGTVAALAARCPHLGSDLSQGRVVGDTVECPYHRFRFDSAGICREHDLAARSWAVTERFGAIFVFPGPEPLFPLPAFAGDPDLVSAAPMHWHLGTQWYMVVANGFDGRHFSHAHDRHLVGPPRLTRPDRYSMRVDYQYRIAGSTPMNKLTRLVSGSIVDFAVTGWGGNIALVHARFARDQSLGIVLVEPDYEKGSRSARVTVIVNAVRKGRSIQARLLDRLTVKIKRFAIRRFMLDDSRALQQLDYGDAGLRPGDEVLAAYLRWVADLRNA